MYIPECSELFLTDVSSGADVLKYIFKPLSLNPVHAVFQGLLRGGGAAEEAERREVPQSLGGARPDEPG